MSRLAIHIDMSESSTESSTESVRADLARHGLTEQTGAQALRLCALMIEQQLGLTARLCQYEVASELLNQRVVEMDTGEGKSIAVAMAAATMALCGSPVHIMTSNDYLAQRDANLFASVFDQLGIRVASVLDIDPVDNHRQGYAADICYGTARTFAFDYLRDQKQLTTKSASELVANTSLRGLCCAIVDEADSVLLDEATMPLVLAQAEPDPNAKSRLWQAIDLAARLQEGSEFTLNRASQRATLTELGRQTIAALADDYSEDWLNSRYCDELVTQALTATRLLTRDINYIVRDDEIAIVDQSTGRIAHGRHFPGDVHALVAVKERVTPPAPTRPTTGLTYPRFFARYHHLSGVSATVCSARRDFKSLYGLKSQRVNRHSPSRAISYPVRVFRNRNQQFSESVRRATDLARAGRAVLVGTDSIQDSLLLAAHFRGTYPVVLLSAGSEEQEAEVIAQAGTSGTITISTQIAGRGTDITCDAKTLASGGLHVLNLQHNRSARLDKQMNGRSARQGHPGSHEHWYRLKDSPYSDQRLPGWVFSGLQACAWLKLPKIGVFLVQQFCQFEDRLTRLTRLQADRKWSRRLHFSSMKDL
jgi:preprotein translocase subunit SecA